jgi:hypothetical protein
MVVIESTGTGASVPQPSEIHGGRPPHRLGALFTAAYSRHPGRSKTIWHIGRRLKRSAPRTVESRPSTAADRTLFPRRVGLGWRPAGTAHETVHTYVLIYQVRPQSGDYRGATGVPVIRLQCRLRRRGRTIRPYGKNQQRLPVKIDCLPRPLPGADGTLKTPSPARLVQSPSGSVENYVAHRPASETFCPKDGRPARMHRPETSTCPLKIGGYNHDSRLP